MGAMGAMSDTCISIGPGFLAILCTTFYYDLFFLFSIFSGLDLRR